jgi:hypothetical protein
MQSQNACPAFFFAFGLLSGHTPGWLAQPHNNYAVMRIVRIAIYAYNEHAWPGIGITGHGGKATNRGSITT